MCLRVGTGIAIVNLFLSGACIDWHNEIRRLSISCWCFCCLCVAKLRMVVCWRRRHWSQSSSIHSLAGTGYLKCCSVIIWTLYSSVLSHWEPPTNATRECRKLKRNLSKHFQFGLPLNTWYCGGGFSASFTLLLRFNSQSYLYPSSTYPWYR